MTHVSFWQDCAVARVSHTRQFAQGVYLAPLFAFLTVRYEQGLMEDSMVTQKFSRAGMATKILLVLTGLFAAGQASAATYYVDAAAAADTGTGTSVSPKKYIQSGLALLSTAGGDVLVVSPGTYSNAKDAIASVPSGKLGAYNVVRAAVDGTVTIKQSFYLGTGDHFVQFEGLKWDFADTKAVLGRYVKFLRCAFKGGPGTGNNVTVQIGSNDVTPGAQYILLEDSWVYGPGGRYKVLVYNSDKVVLRRLVVRHDGGWTFDGSNPQAGITIYDSTNIQAQNVMVVDSLTGLDSFESNIYLVANATTAQRAGNVALRGSVVIGGGGNGIAWDGSSAYTSSLVEDVVVWGSSAGGIATNGSANKGTVNRATVKSGGAAFADWRSAGGVTVSNSIAYKNTGAVCEGITVANSIAFGNGNNNCGRVLDPTTNGLLYLPRTEAGSVLATAGAAGAQVGAQIVNRIGVSGTLYGDTGYDQVTTTSLWPWPNEARIKTDFADYNSRGFSAGTKTLTDYVWSYLGNASPAFSSTTVAPKAPTGLLIN